MKNLLLNDPVLTRPLDFNSIAPAPYSVERTESGISFNYKIQNDFYCLVDIGIDNRNTFSWYLPCGMCSVLAFDPEGFFVMNFEEDYNFISSCIPNQSVLDHINLDLHDIELFMSANRVLLMLGYSILENDNGK